MVAIFSEGATLKETASVDVMRTGTVLSRTNGGRSKVTVWAQIPTGTDVSKIRVCVHDTGECSGRAMVKICILLENELLNAESLLQDYARVDPDLTHALQETLDGEFRSKTSCKLQYVEVEQLVPLLPPGVQVEPLFRN